MKDKITFTVVKNGELPKAFKKASRWAALKEAYAGLGDESIVLPLPATETAKRVMSNLHGALRELGRPRIRFWRERQSLIVSKRQGKRV